MKVQIDKIAIIWGAIFGLLTVTIGAFGAHGLKEILEANTRMATFETAVKYQSFHALALILVGILNGQKSKYLNWTVSTFVTGTVVFSGSLYVLSLTNVASWGMVTPLGGLLMIVGWVCLITGIVTSDRII